MRQFELIAEVKTRSPFGWKSSHSWEELFQMADEHGDMISVHTDERWGGSWELLKQARSRTRKPILAKGIHASDDDIRRAFDCGADWVLAVGRVPGVRPEKCLIEPHMLSDLSMIPAGLRVVWNARDLTTGEQKRESFEDARRMRDGWLCQASLIRRITDVKNGADAVLVGTHLSEFLKSLQK